MKIIFTYLFLLSFTILFSQQKDSISYQVSSTFTLANKKEQPFWLTSNKGGLLSDNNHNSLITIPISYSGKIRNVIDFNSGLQPAIRNTGSYDFETGGSVFLVNYYSNLSFNKVYLRIGAESRSIAQYGDELSTGSLVQTINARPIPKITFGTEYFNIPFTFGHLQVKGEFSHGWLEKERTVSNPWLHQKFLFFKLGAKFPINMELGLTHNSLWGGTLDGIESRFIWDDYWNVITGGISNRNSTNVGTNDSFVYGFHTGTIDLAINFEAKSFEGTIYAQKPWEDGEQISKHKMFIKYFENNDGLFGLKIIPKTSPIFRKITIEYIQTKFQGGPGLPDPPPFVESIIEEDPDGCLHNQCQDYNRRENYYNNFIYNGGWTFYERSIGTPLFTHQKRIENLLIEEDLGEIYGRNTVYNNRVEGFHLGIAGAINERSDFVFKYTYTINFGNYYAQYGRGYNEDYTGWSRYGEPYYFENGIDQSYILLQLNHYLKNQPIELNIASGFDFGGINDSYGVLFGIKYNYVSAEERGR